MNNDSQVKTVKYLTPLFGILCGVAASVIFFSCLLGVSVLAGMGFSPFFTIPILAGGSIYSLRSWLVLLHENKSLGWGIFIGFFVGMVIISFFILLAVTVLISPA
jgi:hypothetical protein